MRGYVGCVQLLLLRLQDGTTHRSRNIPKPDNIVSQDDTRSPALKQRLVMVDRNKAPSEARSRNVRPMDY